MAVEVYLTFNGNCREAVYFYKDVFETDEPKIMTFGDSPHRSDDSLQEDAKNLIMHTRLVIDGSTVMFSDTFPGAPYSVGNNITLAYVAEDAEKLKAVYDKLKVNGNVKMELQETFWSKLYGQVEDQFGILWQLNLGQ